MLIKWYISYIYIIFQKYVEYFMLGKFKFTTTKLARLTTTT